MAHSVHLERVPTLTPVESGNPWTFFPADYLSPLFCGKEIAVLRTPLEIDGDGSEACSSKPDDTSPLWTAVKIATYILSAGILPLLAFLLTIAVRSYKDFHYTVEVQPPHSPSPESQSVIALQSPRETERPAVVSALDSLDFRLPTNTSSLPKPAGELRQEQIERLPPVTRPVRAIRAPWTPSDALRDDTPGKIAELRPSEETNSAGKPYQSLFLKSEKTQQYHKVILLPFEKDQPVQTHFDLSAGDDVSVSEGLWVGDQKQMIISIKNTFGLKVYTLDLPPIPIDYRDPNGEKVYITDITSLQFKMRLKYDPKQRERLAAVFPNLVPPIVAEIEPGAKITAFQRKGKMHDFTHEAIAGLAISDEPHAETEKPHEYLTLNEIKVLLYKRDVVDFRLHFDLQDDEDAIVIKHGAPGTPVIKIEEHTGYDKNIQQSYALHLERPYQRTFTNANGDTCTENVLITNVSDETFENNEALRKTFSLVWPPVR